MGGILSMTHCDWRPGIGTRHLKEIKIALSSRIGAYLSLLILAMSYPAGYGCCAEGNPAEGLVKIDSVVIALINSSLP